MSIIYSLVIAFLLSVSIPSPVSADGVMRLISKASSTPMGSCLRGTYPSSDGSANLYPNLQVYWDRMVPGCDGVLWVINYAVDLDMIPEDEPIFYAFTREIQEAYRNGDPIATEKIDRFSRRVASGEFPELAYLLPQTRNAGSTSCSVLGCGVKPPVLVTTWCEDSHGNPVAVSDEVCRDTPGYVLRTERSR